MAGWLRGLLRNGQLAVDDYAGADGMEVQAQPARRAAPCGVIGRAVSMNPTRLEQAVVLLKLSTVIGIVNAVGASAATFDYRKAWYVAGAIGDVNHVLNRNAPIFRLYVGVYVDRGVLVGALVDFVEGTRLGSVVYHHANLSYHRFGGNGHLVLVEESGLQGILDKLAAPDPIDMFGDRATTHHLRQTGADDVVLQLNLVLAILEFLAGVAFGEIEKVGQSWVEFDVGPVLIEHAVVESAKFPREHVSEQVIQIADLAGDIIAALPVVFMQGIGLRPEHVFFDSVSTKEGRLHITGD